MLKCENANTEDLMESFEVFGLKLVISVVLTSTGRIASTDVEVIL